MTTNYHPILDWLGMTVPLEMQRMQTESPWELQRLARESVVELAERGDVLQFGGPGAGKAATALARGLAAAALTAPGGVDFAGLHFCVDGTECTYRQHPCAAGSFDKETA